MKDNETTITARLLEIQTELIGISRAVIEANKPLGTTFNGRPNPGSVARSHQDLFDINARIICAANRIDRLRMDLKQEET